MPITNSERRRRFWDDATGAVLANMERLLPRQQRAHDSPAKARETRRHLRAALPRGLRNGILWHGNLLRRNFLDSGQAIDLHILDDLALAIGPDDADFVRPRILAKPDRQR